MSEEERTALARERNRLANERTFLSWTRTGLAIVGIFIGDFLSKKIHGNKLKKGFGWFVLIMGIYIIIKELFFPGSGGH